MLQASFRNLLPTDKELERMLYEHVDKHMADIAAEIATETRQRAPKLKGLLVKSVRARPSKFEAGGYIVVVRAPHAHLVEYGHNIVDRKGVVRGKEYAQGWGFLQWGHDESLSGSLFQSLCARRQRVAPAPWR
jgi:hypothetical protein